ncbi:heme NO-binding domain-containing protein [Thalassococcus sp. CAU 1522]|uniref:Heme NO-binding domain-containing protein n=1 Tax=Thalassococcus arenae TaxID=2851652 RepID=A0ABS6N4G2_9RHOB|nr:heme NO-binding domain-containing protein [Thalassococcus arenae]MBV2358479.1 heme NO-binding domain-containing protein [Thalassococcus arenae]
MHGLILRTLQRFLQDTYGREAWMAMAEAAHLEDAGFEAMLSYDPSLLDAVLDAAAVQLSKPREVLLEDAGTYLVSHPGNERLRRLLRFGGIDFIDFLHSLDDLPDRVRLAVPDLHLPEIELRDFTASQFSLHVHESLPGFGHVLVGLLRAMADDYGALVLLDHQGASGGAERVEIQVIETDFASGRDFDLAGPATPRMVS